MGLVTKNVTGAPKIWIQTSRNFYNGDNASLTGVQLERNANQPTSNMLTINRKGNGTVYMGLTLYQLIIFNRDLTVAEIEEVRKILINKEI